jgi:K+-transporting ATPase c subunit
MNDAQVRYYYRKLVPNYNASNKTVNVEQNKQYYSSNSSSTNSSSNNTSDSNQVLIEKLNYMINLLEEQQDQKTGSVTEEVVLYSFLGVFIIFVVDSFARVGKYVR